MEPEHSGAREKDCKDFVSDLRLFFHKGVILNLGDLPAAYAALEMPSELVCELEEALSSLRRFREGITPFILGKDRVSRAKLFHIFVYGSLAHVNPEKREIYEKWKSNPGIFALLESHFLQNLFQHVELLFRIYSVNSEALLLIA